MYAAIELKCVAALSPHRGIKTGSAVHITICVPNRITKRIANNKHMLEPWAKPAHSPHARPDLQRGVGPQRHQDIGLRSLNQLGDMFGIQQVIDGAGQARDLGPEEREIGLRNGRQQERHARFIAARKAVEEVGRAPHIGGKFTVRPALRQRGLVGVFNESQGRAIGVALRSILQRIRQAGVGHELVVCKRLDALHVGLQSNSKALHVAPLRGRERLQGFTTLALGGSAYSASTSAARRVSTVRWLT